MAVCATQSEIEDLAANALAEADRLRVEHHVAGCADCRARLQRLEQSRRPHSDDEATGLSSTTQHPSQHAAVTFAVPGYRILSEIHRGGQGVVYKAIQESTNRTVAVKMLPHESDASPSQRQRFEREISLAANLRHPNIVTVYDSGLTSGRYFFAMEYVHGQPLHTYGTTNALSIPEKLRLFCTICDAVSYAHQQGVIHRDLKPHNILVDARGEPHVVDFGLAKSALTSAPLTLTSQFMGTLAYASPEQTKGDPMLIDARSDAYSLGVILFEMLTGELPYPMHADLASTFQAIRHLEPRSPSSIARGINRDLDTIVLRALAKEPQRRYQTVADLRNDIERTLVGEPIQARRDSVSYLLRLRARRFIQRRRVSSVIAMAVLATIGAYGCIELIAELWPQAINGSERLVTSWMPQHSASGPFEQVRIIAIDDATKAAVEQLAAQEGFNDVNAGTWPSLRRLHGRLMQRLARSGAKAVVWDIQFRLPLPFDSDLVEGIDALQQAGVNPVIAVNTWALTDDSRPQMSPEILARRVSWGGITMGQSTTVSWRAHLVVSRGEAIQMNGLALAALGAMRHPMMDFSVHLDEARETVQLRFFARDPDMLHASSIAAGEKIRLSGIQRLSNPTLQELGYGFQHDDLVGLYVFEFPDDKAIADATIAYEDVFAADDNTLREWFSGRLVLIGDFRRTIDKPDWHATPDGRELAGPHAHAAAIDKLLTDAVSMRYPLVWQYWMWLACGALVGAFAGAMFRRPVTLVMSSTAALVAIILIGVLAFRTFGLILDPIGPAIAFLLALIASAWVQRLHSQSAEFSSQRSLAT